MLPYLTPQEIDELDRLIFISPLSFRDFILTVNPRYQFYPYLNPLIEALEQVAAGELKRLMVFLPPRHGKSELVSRLFSAYYLYCNPAHWVGINSYAAALAYTFSRNARDNYTRIGGTIKADAGAVTHWETGQGGGLWAAGVGGPITGKGFNLGIIDDPLKNAEDAASEVIRAKQKDWYNSTFYTRQEPEAAIVVIQTRWHEDDLSGHILSKEAEEPEGWHIIHLEAIKEPEPPEYPETCTIAPDARQPDEALNPERYPLAKLRKIAARIGSYFFGALYQQRPKPREGGMFKRAWFKIVDRLPIGARAVRYWDKAGTEGGGKETAGVKMGEYQGKYYIADVVHGQWEAPGRERVIKQTAEIDGVNCHIWIEQEPGSGGKESAQATIRNLAGYVVKADRPTGDKALRAEPFAAQAEAGNVYLVQGEWNYGYLEQLTTFPNGKFKDLVDGSSGGFNALISQGQLSIADNPIY